MATVDIRGASLSLADPPISTNPNADLAWKAPVRVATTGGNINLQTIGLGPVDGVSLNVGDRVLVKDQTDQTTNGIYNAQSSVWTRAIDFNNNSQVTTGLQVAVAAGINNAGANYRLTTAYPVIIGTSALVFASPAILGTQQFGPLPFVQADTYAAGTSQSSLFAVRGTNATPVTDSCATALFQSTVDTTNVGLAGNARTVYASIIKLGTTANCDYRAFEGEAVDNAGGAGSSIAGGRFTASVLSGTSGNATGLTCLGLANQAYAYIFGSESQVWNNSGTDQTASFNPLNFASAVLVTTLGTNKPDAAVLLNPFSTSGKGFVTGFFVPTNTFGAGNDTVTDTAFRCDATCINGIDLSRGTYSGSAIKSTGFAVSNSGAVTASLTAVSSPSNANAASAGVSVGQLYCSTANPCPVYIRTA